MILGHGVGSVYELPIPLYLYLLGAGATVLLSFVVRALARTPPRDQSARKVAGPGAASALRVALRAGGLAGLVLALIVGVVQRSEGFTLAPLLFWVGLIVGTTAVSALLAGTWEAADPWATLERVYRIDDAGGRPFSAPWWMGPLGLYLLFWFELVSEVGFDDFFVVAALVVYSLFSFSLRASFGSAWAIVDPLSILFGFAARIAPFELGRDGVYRKSLLRDLDADEPMPRALFVSVFLLLASTTYDNLSETVGWFDFLDTVGLDGLPEVVLGSIALAALSLVFLVPFIAGVWVAHLWVGRDRPLGEVAGWFGWSLIPIGIAYLLAHNAPLVILAVPTLIRALADPLDLGWNLIGTANLFENFTASPRVVWFIEIGLIVAGHILGVLAAHTAGHRLGETHSLAVRSQYALTALMTLYTVTTLWLLAQPLVV
jgi:hypothetical protein